VTSFSRAAAVALSALLLLGGCGDDDDAGNGGGDTTAAPADGGETADRSELSSFDTVTAMNEELTAAGIGCTLEYEGLRDAQREISQCTIEGEQAILTVWLDEEVFDAFLAPEEGPPPVAVAYGANWTVELATPENAQTVADALGGAITGV